MGSAIRRTSEAERWWVSLSIRSHELFSGERLPLLEAQVDEALWLASSLEGDGVGIALDFYSGVGLFTLPLGTKFEKVVGIESDANSVKHARRNAHSNDADTVSFMAMSTDRVFREQKKLAQAPLRADGSAAKRTR